MKREDIWHEQRRWLTRAGKVVIAIYALTYLTAAVVMHPRMRIVTKVERVVVNQPADVSAEAKIVCAEADNDQILRRDRLRLESACAGLEVMSSRIIPDVHQQ